MKYNWNIEDIKQYIKDSTSYAQVLSKLGIPNRGNNIKTLKNIIKEHNIIIDHFIVKSRNIPDAVYIEEYLSNKKKISSDKLKKKLFKLNIKTQVCERCGLTEWNGSPIVLQLHHKDGNPLNNNLSNLEILCPNCHSQTENYANKHRNKKVNRCIICGKEINKTSVYCQKCAAHVKQKVKMPDKEELLNKLKSLKSTVNVGRFYGVSDVTVRHWLKSYDISPYKKDIILLINE